METQRIGKLATQEESEEHLQEDQSKWLDTRSRIV